MKNLLIASIFCFSSIIFSNQAFAQIQVGAGLVYGFDIEEVGIQLNGTYELSPEMRVGGDLTYWLVGDEEFFGVTISSTFLEINGNFHYIFMENDGLLLYGLGTLGIHYAGVEVEAGGQSTSDSDTEIGLGIGAGVEYNLGPVNLFVEPRLFLTGFDQFNIGFGIRYKL